MPVVPEVLHVVFGMVWLQHVCHGCSSARAKRRHPTREAGGWLGAGKMGTGSAFSAFIACWTDSAVLLGRRVILYVQCSHP